MSAQACGISVVIPTWRRERVLLDTLEAVLHLLAPGDELIVVDQTAAHEPATAAALGALERQGRARLIRRARPSIPAAMNAGLCAARQPLVLFLDDDVIPEPGLLAAHRRAHQEGGAVVVAGRVVQPWDRSPETAGRNPFFSGGRGPVEEFMGGNFSVRRDAALALGGFDEHFVRVAHRFEKEFADRVLVAGGRILFEPEAGIEHLRAGGGGTRAYGRGWRDPGHGVGEYYHLLRSPRARFAPGAARRLRQALFNRSLLKRPWLAPIALVTEAAAMLWAVALFVRGPRLLKPGAAPECGR